MHREETDRQIDGKAWFVLAVRSDGLRPPALRLPLQNYRQLHFIIIWVKSHPHPHLHPRLITFCLRQLVPNLHPPSPSIVVWNKKSWDEINGHPFSHRLRIHPLLVSVGINLRDLTEPSSVETNGTLFIRKCIKVKSTICSLKKMVFFLNRPKRFHRCQKFSDWVKLLTESMKRSRKPKKILPPDTWEESSLRNLF